MYRIRYGEHLQIDFAPADSLAADRPKAVEFTPIEECPLALNGRRVDSVVAAPWTKHGFILAVRLHDAKRSQSSYCWAAFVDGYWWADEIGLTTPDSETPYDASDINKDFRGGDTIAMHWIRAHVNLNGEGAADDLLYVNVCPGNNHLGLRDVAQKLYRVRHQHDGMEEIHLTEKK
jgi:hypothetical protein